MPTKKRKAKKATKRKATPKAKTKKLTASQKSTIAKRAGTAAAKATRSYLAGL